MNEVLDHRHVVGTFFEEIVCWLLGAEKTDVMEGDGRILDGIGVGIEVKGSDNNHPFRVETCQLDSHQKLLGFPLDAYVYCFCGYKNKETSRLATLRGKSRCKLLGRLKNRQDVESFLAQNFNTLFIVDIHVLLRIRQNAVYGLLIGKREEGSLKLRRTDLNLLAQEKRRGIHVNQKDLLIPQPGRVPSKVRVTTLLTHKTRKCIEARIDARQLELF